MDKLEGMISKIREAQQSIDSSGPRKLPQRDKTIQKTNHQITDQLMTVAKLSRLLIEWVMSDEMLREDSLNTALEMCAARSCHGPSPCSRLPSEIIHPYILWPAIAGWKRKPPCQAG